MRDLYSMALLFVFSSFNSCKEFSKVSNYKVLNMQCNR